MTRKIWVGALALAIVAGSALAQDPKKAPSAEEKAAWEAMVKAGTPGDAHKKLSDMVGDFNVTVKSYMQPGAPPQVSTGTSKNSWALDGRWVEQRYTGSFMGMPFNGIGYTGYDNVKKQYVGTWMDNMSTSMMSSTGTADASGKVYEFTSSMDDPVSGKSMPMKQKVTVTDKDNHTMEMWSPGPDGKMYKMMEIAYTRKK